MAADILVFMLYGAATVLLAWGLAAYMARVYAGERVFLSPVLAPLERGFLSLSGIRTGKMQSWKSYAMAVLAFNLAGFVLLYAILRLQGITPWNPESIAPMSPDLAFNTAISFVTNTNWQAYGGESQEPRFQVCRERHRDRAAPRAGDAVRLRQFLACPRARA
jgi:K+-transporting ATPase ATPase A chain